MNQRNIYIEVLIKKDLLIQIQNKLTKLQTEEYKQEEINDDYSNKPCKDDIILTYPVFFPFSDNPKIMGFVSSYFFTESDIFLVCTNDQDVINKYQAWILTWCPITHIGYFMINENFTIELKYPSLPIVPTKKYFSFYKSSENIQIIQFTQTRKSNINVDNLLINVILPTKKFTDKEIMNIESGVTIYKMHKGKVKAHAILYEYNQIFYMMDMSLIRNMYSVYLKHRLFYTYLNYWGYIVENGKTSLQEILNNTKKQQPLSYIPYICKKLDKDEVELSYSWDIIALLSLFDNININLDIDIAKSEKDFVSINI